uniref:C-type lectin domain-containing protein n=1 Tax=Periophthalmus magnuspinnatus TaxID=409849 RepID=A0A3B4A9U7_9GOBI
MDLWVFGVLLVPVVLVWSCPESESGSCLWFEDVPLSFRDAEARCQTLGGHLAFITDPRTQEQVLKVLGPEQEAWIGLKNSTHSGTTPGLHRD